MQNTFLVPNWFLGFDILFELFFAIITLLVAYYSFKVFKLTRSRQPKLFGTAFALMSIGFFIQLSMNALFFFFFRHWTFTPRELGILLYIYSFLIYGYTMLVITGLTALVYTTIKIQDKRILFLIGGLGLIALLFSIHKLLVFYVISTFLTFFIVKYYIHDQGNKNTKSRRVLFGFIAILIADILFLFSMNWAIFYVLGHIAKFAGYIIILIHLFLVIKNGTKKK